MGRAVGVEAELPEPLETKLDDAIGQGNAHTGMILVIGGALDLEGLPIEEEAALGIVTNRADAEALFESIHELSAGFQLDHGGIQPGLLQGPKLGLRDRRFDDAGLLAPWTDLHAPRAFGHLAPGRIEHLHSHLNVTQRGTLVGGGGRGCGGEPALRAHR